MDQLRKAIQDALQEAERLNQPMAAPVGRTAYPLEQPVQRRPFEQRRPLPIDYEGQEAEIEAPRIERMEEISPPPVAPAPLVRSELRALIDSRTALRQAFFLRELLGPPRALQGPDGDGRL